MLLARCQYLHRSNIVRVGHPIIRSKIVTLYFLRSREATVEINFRVSRAVGTCGAASRKMRRKRERRRCRWKSQERLLILDRMTGRKGEWRGKEGAKAAARRQTSCRPRYHCHPFVRTNPWL